jgi:hypothetical protein
VKVDSIDSGNSEIDASLAAAQTFVDRPAS